MSSQFGNHGWENPMDKWLDEQERIERSKDIYRSQYNSQIDH